MGKSEIRECKVAFVGAGAMAREHARAFRDIPGVDLAGVWSRTPERAEALGAELSLPGVAHSIEELFHKTRANLVIIAVLEPAINAVVKECLQFPWAILLEKPPGLNLPDALDIQSAARKKSKQVMVALNRRFLSSTRTAVADLNDIKDDRLIIVSDQEDLIAAAASGYPQGLLENWMYANSIHLIDYFRIFGRGEICSIVPIFPWNPRKPSFVSTALFFESGDRGLYNCAWNCPAPWSVSITSPTIRWEMRPLEKACFQVRGDRKQQGVEPHIWDSEFKPGFRMQADNAVDMALGTGICDPSLDDAVETMKLIASIYEHSGLDSPAKQYSQKSRS
jgi:predicted dehydrogenase